MTGSISELERSTPNDSLQSRERVDFSLTAILTPGQGSQKVGLGQGIADRFPEYAAMWDKAGQIVGGKLIDLWRNGPQEELDQTRWTQPFIVTETLARNAVREARNLFTDARALAGKSLGQIPKFALGGALSEEDAIDLANQRGVITDEVNQENPGRMVALVGVAEEILEALEKRFGLKLCLDITDRKKVFGGLEENVKEAVQFLKQESLGLAEKVFPLSIGGVFHHELQAPAVARLAKVLERITIKDPREGLIIIGNTSASLLRTVDDIRRELLDALTRPVLWRQSMVTLLSLGVGTMFALDSAAQLASETEEMFGGSRGRILLKPDGEGRPTLIGHTWTIEQAE